MNTIRLGTLVAMLCLAAAARAGGDAGLDRVEVTGPRDAARAEGTLDALHGEDSGSFHLSRQPFASAKTRAQVLAEVAAAREAGVLGVMDGEDSGSFYLAAHDWVEPYAGDVHIAATTH
jgi:hypothetical protein